MMIVLLNGYTKQTSGSETSQYREEKRTIVIPLVAASETGGAQTNYVYMVRVVGRRLHLVAKSYKTYV